MKQKIYFGRPINAYGTELERKLLKIILEHFPQFDIENPGQKHHINQARLWKKTTGNAMNYFLKVMLPKCHAGIFLPFRDGEWGAGIFGEAEFLLKRGYPIYRITVNGLITQIRLDEIQVLTIEETRKRIRTQNGKTVPY